MILEGIVTSVDGAGCLNVAPMGPIVDERMNDFIFRPFKSSQTYENLRDQPYGVFHVTDDVLLFAQAAINELREEPDTFPARKVHGRVIASAARWYEFEIIEQDESAERALFKARVVHAGRIRDLFGFNRAQHAVLEGAILATRVHLLQPEEIMAQFDRLKTTVEKTAGPREHEAFDLLAHYVASATGACPRG